MATLYTQQDKNKRRTWLLMAAFFGLVGGIGWVLSYYFGDVTIFYVALGFSIVMNIGAYWFSDKLVLRLAHAREVTREEQPELWNIVENLAITAGLPMPRVYIIDESVPNAFATGRDPKHGVVAVTTGLTQILDRTELEGVIAHELGHIGNRDMLVSTVAVVLAGFVSLVADTFLRSRLHGGGRSSNDSRGNGVVMLIGLVFIILAPLFATLLRLAVSRKREYLADATGALLTRYPEGLASALEKISAHSGRMQHAHKATAHLFISEPFGKKLTGLFATHPPIEKRIAALREMS